MTASIPESDWIYRLTAEVAFPPTQLWRRKDGLVAVDGDLSVERLLLAYRSGLFPWSDNPLTWWSPDPRGIIELDRFHISRSLAAFLRKDRFQVTTNHAFEAVMKGCARRAPGRGQTWISQSFVRGYAELQRAGWAHSVECWLDGKLVGGIYGVGFGRFFAGESMFHSADNASKVALVKLVELLRSVDCELFDIQMVTPATEQFGAIEIPRAEYLRRLATAVRELKPFKWRAGIP